MVVSAMLRENRHRFPCLLDADRAARYCDRTSIWYRLKAAGSYLVPAGLVLNLSLLALLDGQQVAVQQHYDSVFLIGPPGYAIGALCYVICAHPGSPCLCVKWLAKPTWWNLSAWLVSILLFGWLAISTAVTIFMTLRGAPVFYSELSAADTSQMAATAWKWRIELPSLAASIGIMYAIIVWFSENQVLLFRVWSAKLVRGWNWRTKWWIAQVVGIAAALACLIYSIVLETTLTSGLAVATVEASMMQWLLFTIVIAYLLVNPFIMQAEPMLDELRKLNSYQVGYILFGILMAMGLVMSVIESSAWLIPWMIVLAVTVTVLFTAAYLHVMHDRKYFDIILAQEVAA